MTDRVIAISSEVVECGKRLSEQFSKKKFVWRFKISQTVYELQLISSALSGKRIIMINDKTIYSEQNVLNLNFDFNHNISGHSLRISKQSQATHNYFLRIDNRSFQYLLKKKDNPTVETKVAGKYQLTNNDPFQQFQKVANSKTNQNQNNNSGFGDFGDFDNYDWGKQEKKSSQNEIKVEKKNQFSFQRNQQPLIRTQNFETNNVAFEKNNSNYVDLLSEDNFTTNNYANYNNYLGLMGEKNNNSDPFGLETDPKQKSFIDKIKPDLTGKQIVNKTLMTAVEIKKKIVNQFDLI